MSNVLQNWVKIAVTVQHGITPTARNCRCRTESDSLAAAASAAAGHAAVAASVADHDGSAGVTAWCVAHVVHVLHGVRGVVEAAIL